MRIKNTEVKKISIEINNKSIETNPNLKFTDRQRQLEEERNQKLKQLSDAHERQKREIQENKMRRGQLAESCDFFESKPEPI